MKDVLSKKVKGKTIEEVVESLKNEISYLKQVGEAFGKDVKIKGIISADKIKEGSEKEEKEPMWTSKKIREHDDIPERLKGEVINILWTKGSKKMLEFLKSHEIEIK